MNLKEAYRYANFLDKMFDRGINLLTSSDFVTTKKQNHLRKKSNPSEEDEVIIVPKTTFCEATPMQVVDFTVALLCEREKVHNAIAEAKKKMGFNLDAVLSANKKKHTFIGALSYLNNMKPSEAQSMGSGYMLNINKEPVEYYYTIEETRTIDYDRNQVKGLLKKILKETDETSSKLDMLEINTQVEFSPAWDVNDSFDDLIESLKVEKEEVA